jgi:hypothetical protein
MLKFRKKGWFDDHNGDNDDDDGDSTMVMVMTIDDDDYVYDVCFLTRNYKNSLVNSLIIFPRTTKTDRVPASSVWSASPGHRLDFRAP